MIYRNANYTSRNYECTNIVACEADTAPGPQWVAATRYILTGLTMLYRQAGVTYYGYL